MQNTHTYALKVARVTKVNLLFFDAHRKSCSARVTALQTNLKRKLWFISFAFCSIAAYNPHVSE